MKEIELAWTHTHTHTLRRNAVVKQALQWTRRGHGRRRRPTNTWRRELESEVGTAEFEYSWRLKSTREAAAVDRTGWRKWSVAYAPLGATRRKSIKD